ncbi:MAG: HU family DNA-binding protein, partial [Alphaproteobacteria bacterium]
MNKQELVAAVAKAADMTKEKAAEAVDAVFDSITAGLKQDGEVRLMG